MSSNQYPRVSPLLLYQNYGWKGKPIDKTRSKKIDSNDKIYQSNIDSNKFVFSQIVDNARTFSR